MSYKKERIYIVVKTYPTISDKYAELVCTAGVREDGSWIRLYPVPFRLLFDDQKYQKYSWIQVDVERQAKDFRPESYRPDLSTVVVEPQPPKIDWQERRKILFKNKEIYTNKKILIQRAHDRTDPISLALFKPSKITDFIIEKDARTWDAKKIASLKEESKQLNLFKTEQELEQEFKVVEKLPYKFYYKFEDNEGKSSKLMIEDWEVGMLYRNCLKQAKGDETIALSKVKDKYFNYFLDRDIYFILGTTMKNHYTSRNPFIIVGVFYPPKLDQYEQISLNLDIGNS